MKIEKKAAKALRKMPAKTANRFFAAFEKIEAGNTRGLDVKPMVNFEGYSRLRIGNYRAIYTKDYEVIVIDAGPRGDVYKEEKRDELSDCKRHGSGSPERIYRHAEKAGKCL